MVALWNRADHYIFILWFLLLFFFFFFSSPNLSCCRLYIYHTSTRGCGLSANLGSRSETCYARLAGNTGRKKLPKSRHHHTTLSGYIFATKACIDNWKKNLLNSNISSRCPQNMVNFGPLVTEIISLVWGTPANFNGFHILAVLLHGTLVVGINQTLRC